MIILPDHQLNIGQLRKLFATELTSHQSKSVLQPRTTNIDSPLARQKQHSLNIVEIASKTINYCLNNINNDTNHPNETNELFSVCSLAFNVLKENKIVNTDAIKQHQVFIIRCVSHGKLEYAMNEVWEVYNILKEILIGSTSVSKIDQKELIRGLEYSSNSDSTANMVSSFNILYLQVILSQMAKNKEKSIGSQNVMKLLSNDSNQMKWINSLKDTKIKHMKYKSLSKLALSFANNNNSVLKLSFLLKSLQFAACSGSDESEINDILKKTMDTFDLMFNKNDKLVYQYTSMTLNETVQAIGKLKDRYEVLKITKSFEKFKRVNSFQDEYDWCSAANRSAISNNGQSDVLTCLENITVGRIDHQSIIDVLDSSNLTNQFNDELLIRSLVKATNYLIKSYENSQIKGSYQLIIDAILRYHEKSVNNSRLSNHHLQILDPITLFVRSLDPRAEFEFINNCLKSLFNVLSVSKQYKRVRNLSNLYYNFGSKLLGASFESSYNFWLRSIRFEEFILNDQQGTESIDEKKNNMVFMQQKIERIVSLLIENGRYEYANELLTKFLIVLDKEIQQQYQDNFWSAISLQMPLILQLFSKIILNDSMNISLSEYFSDQLKAILFINFIKLVEKSGNVRTKTQLITNFIQSLKMKDNGIFLYCVYKYYDTNGIEYIRIDTDGSDDLSSSCLNNYKELLMSAIQLQVCINEEYNQDLLLESISQFESWLRRTQGNETLLSSQVIEIEFDIFMNMINYLNFQGLTGYVAYLLKSYRNNRKNCEDEIHNDRSPSPSSSLNHPNHSLYIELQLCETNMNLLFPKQISNSLTSSGVLMKTLQLSDNEVINWKLLQFEYCLLIGNLTHGKEKFQTILTFLQDNDNFDVLSNSHHTSTIEKKFENLIILGKFQYLTSLLNFELTNYVESVNNCKKSIKIMNSILKKLGNNVAKTKYNQIKWSTTRVLIKAMKHLVSVSVQLGMTRECEYYLEELTKLNESNVFPLINCSINYYVCELKLMMGDLHEANRLLIKGDKIYSGLCFVDKLLEMESYSIHCVYFSLIGDDENQSFYNVKLEEFFENLVKSSLDDLIDTFGDLKLNSEVLKMFKLNEDEFQLFMRLKLRIDYKRLLYSKNPNSKLFPSTTTKQKYHFYYDLILNNVIKGKRALYDAKQSLVSKDSDPITSSIGDSVSSLPEIVPNPSFPRNRGVTAMSSSTKNSISKLNESKELLMNGIRKGKIYSKNHELRDMIKTLSDSFSLLSTISTIDRGLLADLFYMSEIPRYLPFVNDKLASDSMREDRTAMELLPDSEFSQDQYKVLESCEELFNEVATVLPKDWLCVSIDVCPTSGDLIVTKFDSETFPFEIRLPLDRHANRDTLNDEDASFSFKEAMDELKLIIQESDATTKIERTSQIKTKEERKEWWKERFELDLRLEKLLKDIEYCWFGGFRGIFSRYKVNDTLYLQFKRSFERILHKYVPSRKIQRRSSARAAVFASSSAENGNFFARNSFNANNNVCLVGDFMEIDDEVLKLFIGLAGSEKLDKTELLEDLIYFVLDILLFHGEQNAYDEIDMDQVYIELEEILISYHRENGRQSGGASEYKHIVLIPSKSSVFFPWESLPVLRDRSVSRMPSIKLLLDNLRHKPLTIDATNGYYILNPAGDLKRTEDNFKSIFREKPYWDGCVGVKPTEQEFISGVQDKLFIYLGHGGGEQYVRTNSLKQLNNIGPSLLLGCSSGVLKDMGSLEPYGTVYSYLIGGSSMVLANLWDVTDKDIDRFSLSLLEHWGLLDTTGMGETKQKMNICEAVASSRDECNLKFLNGAAPVVYGLPLVVEGGEVRG